MESRERKLRLDHLDLASAVVSAWRMAMADSPSMIEQWRKIVEMCDVHIEIATKQGDAHTVAFNKAIKLLAEAQLSQAIAEKMSQ